MHPEMKAIKCSIMRGGTSKGIFLMVDELPQEVEQREKVILSIFGSPDVRQIDGLGGADLLTSKLAIISPTSRADADVDYTFAQVGIDSATVNLKGNCGNVAAAVGPFVINRGLVEAVEPITTVRIHLTNSKNLLVVEVPVKDGKALVEGDFSIDGVPGTGAKITLDWKDAQGAFTGNLFPTGNLKDEIKHEDKVYSVTIVDLGNPLVFVKASDLGLKGTETPLEIESNEMLMKVIEVIRGKSAQKIGMISNWQTSIEESAYVPFVAIVSPPKSYTTFDGKKVSAEEIDLTSRLVFMQKMHKSYPVTSTVSTGVAAKVPGTVVYDVISEKVKNRIEMEIGHPAGKITAEAHVVCNHDQIVIKKAAMYRTARLIMDGQVYVKNSVFE